VERGDHGHTDADRARASGDGGREYQRAREVPVIGSVVLEHRHRNEAEPLSPRDHVQCLAIPLGHGDTGERGVPEVKPQGTERHGRLP
jgi:hypothetical protein